MCNVKATSKVLRKKLKTKCTLSEFNFFSTGNFLKVYFFITFYFLNYLNIIDVANLNLNKYDFGSFPIYCYI